MTCVIALAHACLSIATATIVALCSVVCSGTAVQCCEQAPEESRSRGEESRDFRKKESKRCRNGLLHCIPFINDNFCGFCSNRSELWEIVVYSLKMQ